MRFIFMVQWRCWWVWSDNHIILFQKKQPLYGSEQRETNNHHELHECFYQFKCTFFKSIKFKCLILETTQPTVVTRFIAIFIFFVVFCAHLAAMLALVTCRGRRCSSHKTRWCFTLIKTNCDFLDYSVYLHTELKSHPFQWTQWDLIS